MWVAFALQKLLTFFQQKMQHICVSLDINFNESLTNDIVSFEQLGPVFKVKRLLYFTHVVNLMDPLRWTMVGPTRTGTTTFHTITVSIDGRECLQKIGVYVIW